jgi:hypothetical protein
MLGKNVFMRAKTMMKGRVGPYTVPACGPVLTTVGVPDYFLLFLNFFNYLW